MPLAAGRAPDAIPVTDDGLLLSAADHGMHGLLWTWVREHAPDYSARVKLAGYDTVSRQRNARLADTLAQVHQALDAVGITAATLKGITAEARWYTRPGERPSTDVDLLVDAAAAERADEIIGALEPDHPLRRDINGLVRSGAVQSVDLRVGNTPVDVHFDLLKIGIPTRQHDVVWERMQDLVLPDGTTVRVLDADTALVHFLVHLNRDGFPRLLGFADVARILRHEDIDWAHVERFLRGEGLEVAGACSLATVTERLGLPAAPLAATGIRARAWHTAWPTRVTLLGSAGMARSRRQEAIPVLARGRAGDAVRWAEHLVFPPPRTVAVRYPDIRGPYLWRLARGRLRTAGERSAALRERHTPRVAVTPADPTPPPGERERQAIAPLMRRRAAAQTLWLPVWGQSMGWSIRSGDRVRVEPATTPRRGEVWAFVSTNGEIVVHRSRGEGPDGHRFMGDTHVTPDEPVGSDQLIGRVVEIDPPQAAFRWGAAAGGVQRVPRIAAGTAIRGLRRLRAGARRGTDT
ncbi:MAG: nucleotidyltransferase family protein [Acidimicrobiia bacterium]